MSYRGPNKARIQRQVVGDLMRHAGEPVVWREYISAGSDTGSAYYAGGGTTRYYREQAITGLLAAPQMGESRFRETQMPAGQEVAGDAMITTMTALGIQDELVWRDVTYRIESDSTPERIGGRVMWRTVLRRGDDTTAWQPSPPSVVLSNSDGATVYAAFEVTATFSNAVTGLSVGEITVTNGTASALSGSGTTYTFTVTPTAVGDVTTQIPAGVCQDESGRTNTASNELVRNYVFQDAFTRADGALGDDWTSNASWQIGSNTVTNTPTLGSEEFADGGLEGNYTGGFCDSWAATAGTGVQSADVHGGSKAQQWQAGAYAQSLRMLMATADAAVGEWFHAEVWAKRTVIANNGIAFELASTNWLLCGVKITDASYDNLATQALCMSALSMSTYARNTLSGVGDTVIIDDLSLKRIMTADLFAVVEGPVDVTAQIEVTLPDQGVWGGLVVSLDSVSNPQNYVVVMVNPPNKLYAIKVVGGVPDTTYVLNETITYSAGQAVKIVKATDTYQFFYNGAQIGGDVTISDAGIINNVYHGMFGTYNAVQFDNFELGA